MTMVVLSRWSDSCKRTRAAQQITLAKLNTQLLQMLEFSLTLDTFSDDIGPQYFTQQFEATYQRLLGRIDVDITNHGKIDLDDRGTEPDQVPQVDSAPGEVVHGNAVAAIDQAIDVGLGPVVALHNRVLGQFEYDPTGSDSVERVEEKR